MSTNSFVDFMDEMWNNLCADQESLMVFRLSVRISRSFARSTRRLCEQRKSAPMIGWVTSAMMKRHEYFWRPRLSIIWRVPNVLIGEPLAAMRERLQVFRVSDRLGGMTLNSEPVSTRKYLPDLSSYTRTREEFESSTGCLLSTG